MTSRVVNTTPRADADVFRISEWWREHRPAAPYLFEDELDDAFALLAEQPDAGHAYPRPGFPKLRRLLMRRTMYHVYYEHLSERNEVLVHTIWSAVRGRGPTLSRC